MIRSFPLLPIAKKKLPPNSCSATVCEKISNHKNGPHRNMKWKATRAQMRVARKKKKKHDRFSRIIFGTLNQRKSKRFVELMEFVRPKFTLPFWFVLLFFFDFRQMTIHVHLRRTASKFFLSLSHLALLFFIIICIYYIIHFDILFSKRARSMRKWWTPNAKAREFAVKCAKTEAFGKCVNGKKKKFFIPYERLSMGKHTISTHHIHQAMRKRNTTAKLNHSHVLNN